MLHFACKSDPGLRHHDNQDRWFANAETGFFLVSDGMANDIAPQIVVEQLPSALIEILANYLDIAQAQWHEQLQLVFEDINQQVYYAMADRGEIGLGATLVAAFVHDARALIAHIGDSRAYLFRGGELQQLTRDHSLVQRLLALGSISEEDAKNARGNGGPTRFLGQTDPVEAELQCIELLQGDRLLLCSDGLTEMLRDEEIAEVFEPGTSCAEICNELIEAANEAGGRDNVTALVVEIAG